MDFVADGVSGTPCKRHKKNVLLISWKKSMNIIKGLDRISLVIAILATVPGFMIGFFAVNDMFKGVAPEDI